MNESRQNQANQNPVRTISNHSKWLHTAQWGECDPAGIVFYPNFYRWFDASTHQLMGRQGFGQSAMVARFGIAGFALIDSGAQFKHPVRWENEVAVCSHISSYSQKTMTIAHEICLCDTPEIVCVKGFEVRIWAKVNRKTGLIEAKNLPDEFVDYLRGGTDLNGDTGLET